MGLSSVEQKSIGTVCHCNEYPVAPIKSKMKVLKKIKRKMGLASRNSALCPGPNNLPPLQFHSVHGDNIRISRDCTLAKRYESFCKGITFSARPVKINERVCVRFSEISNNWSGVIRFGFTSNDPLNLRNCLPKYACPDLANKPGYWAKALNERFCEPGNILFYYVTAAGDVHFGINGEEKGIFISGLETRGPLWTLIDIYGNCTAIEFLDARVYAHHQLQRCNGTNHDIDRTVMSLQSMQINGGSDSQPIMHHQPQYNSQHVSTNAVAPLPFHRSKGRNIRLSADRLIATRPDTEFCQGYVFTARPIRIGEKVIVKILRTENLYIGALGLGLTSCDPATLQPNDLPDDSDLLLDRPEYWVVSKDIAATPTVGDEIMFCVTHNGEVLVSINRGTPTIVWHVDQSLQLWAFLDVYGSTQSIRLFSQPPAASQNQIVRHSTSSINVNAINSSILSNDNSIVSAQQQLQPISPRRLQVQLPVSDSVNSLTSCQQAMMNEQCQSQPTTVMPIQSNSRIMNIVDSDMIHLQPVGTVLVVNLPPPAAQSVDTVSQNSRTILAQHATISTTNVQPVASTSSSQTVLATYQNNTFARPLSAIPNQSNYGSTIQATRQDTSLNHTAGAECTICYEKTIDSVLYMCGHMCMCYDCAIQQWRGIGGGHCPLCRAVIRDVIRTYKS